LAALSVWDAVGWTLAEGQSSLLLAFLIATAWRCWRRGGHAAAGALLGVAAAFKFLPAALFALFVRRDARRGLWAGATVFLGLQAAAWATFGTAAFIAYAEQVAPALAPWRGSALNVSLPGVPHRWFAPLDRQDELLSQAWLRAPAAAAALGLAASAATLGAWLWALRRGGLGRDRAYASGVLAVLLAAPLTWFHYLCLALPALWVWWRGPAAAAERLAVAAALWLPPALLVRVFIGYPADGRPLVLGPWASATLLALPTWALLWVFVRLLRAERRGPSAA
jgi:hypothetical protein